MKVIIPVAGAGTRLRPHTYTQPKPLIPVAGKPIIAFVIDQLTEAGVDDFVFVIGYLGEKIKDFLVNRYPHINKTFVKQESRRGLGHALWVAGDALRDAKDIFIVLGDTIFDIDIKLFLEKEKSCLGIKRVEDPRKFGVATLDEHGKVIKVKEKPIIPKSNMALVGLYRIKEVKVFIDALDHIVTHNIQTHNEFQLTDAIMEMINKGVYFDSLVVNNWFDCGQKEVLLQTNALLLRKANEELRTTYEYDTSIIIPPVSIGEGCTISKSIVGPNVTIGENAIINQAILKDSIIGNYAKIEEVVLQSSVIGNDTSIKGLRQSLNIGDNTEIDFS